MKILLWSDVYPPYHGGLEKMTQCLAYGLSARGHSVAVITSDFDEPLPDRECDNGISVYRLRLQSALTTHDMPAILANLSAVAKIKRSVQPDIVHIHSEAPGSFFHLRTTAAWPCPMVMTMHGEVRKFQTGPGTLLGMLFDNASHISTVSRALLDGMRSCAPVTQQKSSVIYNAVATTRDDLPPASYTDTEAPVVFASGRLSSEKGFDVLLAAFRLLLADVPAARLVVAGDGVDEATLHEEAERLGLKKHVEFTGWLDGKEAARRTAAATLVVVPSRWIESFGLVALEAALAGLPVVATCVGGLPEVVEDGSTGLLVPPDDPEAMRGAMLKLLRSPELRKRLGEAARVRAKLRFDPEHMLDQYEAMYKRALQQKATPAPDEVLASVVAS